MFKLTLSTSSNTRRKFLRRTLANSSSVQFLCRSSWIRLGYFDTSSNPFGNLEMKSMLLYNTDRHWFWMNVMGWLYTLLIINSLAIYFFWHSCLHCMLDTYWLFTMQQEQQQQPSPCAWKKYNRFLIFYNFSACWQPRQQNCWCHDRPTVEKEKWCGSTAPGTCCLVSARDKFFTLLMWNLFYCGPCMHCIHCMLICASEEYHRKLKSKLNQPQFCMFSHLKLYSCILCLQVNISYLVTPS